VQISQKLHDIRLLTRKSATGSDSCHVFWQDLSYGPPHVGITGYKKGESDFFVNFALSSCRKGISNQVTDLKPVVRVVSRC